MDSVSGNDSFGVLRATFNAGNSWEPIGKPHHDLLTFDSYDDTKMIAVGKNGQVVRVFFNANNAATTDMQSLMQGQTADNTAVKAFMDGSVFRLVIGAADGALRHCASAGVTSPSWTSSLNTSGLQPVMSIAAAMITVAPPFEVNVMCVNENGDRYDVQFASDGTTTQSTPAIPDVAPLLAMLSNTTVLSIDAATNDLHTYDLTQVPVI